MSNEIDAGSGEDDEAAEQNFQQENEARELEDALDVMLEISAEDMKDFHKAQRKFDATQVEARFREYVRNYGWPSGSELVHGELKTIIIDAIWKDW